MYISKDDVLLGIYAEHLGVLSRNDENIDNAIIEAELEVKSYLTSRYDMDLELSKTGNARNRLVVKFVRTIAIWNIYQIGSKVNIPESREKDYNNVIANLKLIQSEKSSIDGLERKTDSTNGGSNYIKFGGNKPRTNHF